jgi:RNA polymerase sigma factor (sigma-70 family)
VTISMKRVIIGYSKKIILKTFEEILNEHKGIIFKIVNYYCKNIDDRKDLEQEIMIQIWLSHKKYNDTYAWSTYIYRIALNVAIGFYHKDRKVKNNFLKLKSFTEIQDGEDLPLVSDHDLRVLDDFIFQLNEINKALMILYLQSKTYAEISEIIGVSATNVSTKINRIKTQLKIYFKECKDGDR